MSDGGALRQLRRRRVGAAAPSEASRRGPRIIAQTKPAKGRPLRWPIRKPMAPNSTKYTRHRTMVSMRCASGITDSRVHQRQKMRGDSCPALGVQVERRAAQHIAPRAGENRCRALAAAWLARAWRLGGGNAPGEHQRADRCAAGVGRGRGAAPWQRLTARRRGPGAAVASATARQARLIRASAPRSRPPAPARRG